MYLYSLCRVLVLCDTDSYEMTLVVAGACSKCVTAMRQLELLDRGVMQHCGIP
jgi:hypothetical protein